MLTLDNIIWVVPGVIFIYLFNTLRPQESISLSGWPYVFFIVVVATITWKPAEWIAEKELISFVDKDSNAAKLVLSSILAVLWNILLLLLHKSRRITKFIFQSVHDQFYKNCIAWEI